MRRRSTLKRQTTSWNDDEDQPAPAPAWGAVIRLAAVFGVAAALTGMLTVRLFVMDNSPLATVLGAEGLALMVFVLAMTGAGMSRRRPTPNHPDARAPRPMGVQVAAMLSHELSAPLATLRMASELALEDDIDPEQRRQLLGQISQQVARIDKRLQELADVFRLQDGKLQLRRDVIDVPDLCREVIADLRVSRAGQHIGLVHDNDLPAVAGDRLKLSTVLSNIINNAIKYTPAGSSVTVAITSDQDGVRLSVADTGPGIDAEHLPRLFDQFYRAHAEGDGPKGYGLGLFIARTMVELHGGRIWAESEMGRGSCFNVVLPAARPDDDTARHRQAGADAARRERGASVQRPVGA